MKYAFPIPEGWLTEKQAAQRLGISNSTLLFARRRGVAPPNLGHCPCGCRRLFYDPAVVEKWLEEHPQVLRRRAS